MKPLPFFLPWLRLNSLSIIGRVWDERAWPLDKAHLGRAFEIRRDLARARRSGTSSWEGASMKPLHGRHPASAGPRMKRLQAQPGEEDRQRNQGTARFPHHLAGGASCYAEPFPFASPSSTKHSPYIVNDQPPSIRRSGDTTMRVA